MIRLGARWPLPGLIGLIGLAAGATSGWALLQHIGLALLVLLAAAGIATLLATALLHTEGSVVTHTATAGGEMIVRYRLYNQSFWPLVWVLLQPQGPSTLPVEGQLVSVGPRGTRWIDIVLPCPERGRWPAGGWVLHVGDPFGFFEHVRRTAGRDTVTVYPRTVSLPGLNLQSQAGHATSRRGVSSAQPSAMVREVRPYRPGDLPSRIHWLATARHDMLMVREPEGEPTEHTWLVLDLDSRVQYGEGAGKSVELVVAAATGLLTSGGPSTTGMLIVGPGTVVPPNARRGHLRHLLEVLAVTRAAPAELERDLRALRVPAGFNKAGLRSSAVVITPWADARWTTRLPRLAQVYLSVTLVLIDTPELGRQSMLDEQAAELRAAGVKVYRHTTGETWHD